MEVASEALMSSAGGKKNETLGTTKKKAAQRRRRKLSSITWPSKAPGGEKRRTIAQIELEEGLAIRVLDDGQCIVWSVNTKQAPARLTAILRHVSTQVRPPDIIAIQDPPPKFAYKSLGSYGHWYRAADDEEGNAQELTRDNDPSTFPYRIPYSRKPQKEKEVKDLCKVAFLIHNSLEGCRVTEPHGANRGLVATLHVPLADGYAIAFHNFYNHEKRGDIGQLGSLVRDAAKAHILLGDFNLHHPLWAGDNFPKSRIEPAARRLVEEMENAHMRCLNRKGDPTYRRSSQTDDKFTSVVDLVFIKHVLADNDQVNYMLLKNVSGYGTDHTPCSVAINLDMKRKSGLRYLWSQTPQDNFENQVDTAMKCTQQRELCDETAIAGALNDLISVGFEPAIRNLVPVLRIYEPMPTPQPHENTDGVSRTRRWHRAVDTMASGRRGVFHLAQRAHKWSVPRPMAYTPDFKVGTNTYETNDEKANCYVHATWTESRRKGPPLNSTCGSDEPFDFDIPTSAPEFPLPFLDPGRPQHTSQDRITFDELMKILKELPSHKAFGVDGIAYEALKMSRKVIAPYLLRIFNACFQLRLHPDHFKDTITIIIKKPTKPADRPNSYRPIALLNTIGKIFERLIANRLKELVLEWNLLPNTQFGAPGKNTTLALEHLNNTIYRAWRRRLKPSLIGLDLTGAYDHIKRTQLLQTLIAMKIPDWLIQIVWSFLSDRRTYIHMPGYNGGEFWVDVGIPQGSPLSPILFLFYASPLLTDFLGDHSKHRAMMFSYVDDTYIVVTSGSWDYNCALMTAIHDNINQWAMESNLHFSPTKYHVMHFTPPGQKECTLLPEIPEFVGISKEKKADILPQKLVILGVTYDRCLSWIPHIQEIQKKIRIDLANFHRFVGGTFGATYAQRQRLYRGKLLAKIAYAAPAWFIHDPTQTKEESRIQYGLTQVALNMLLKLQTEILKSLTRARANTNCPVMEHEFHVFPILLKLHEIAMNHRCSKHDSASYAEMVKTRTHHTPFLTKSASKICDDLGAHPYTRLRGLATLHLGQIRTRERHGLALETFEKQWATPDTQKKWIKRYHHDLMFHKAEIAYDDYLRVRAYRNQHFHPAHNSLFMDHVFKCYVGLNAAQSTMTIALRTGNMAVNTNHFHRDVNKITEMTCPLCNDALHTAEHLMCHCKALALPRQLLVAAVGHCHWETLMTEECEMASSFAIRYFELDQFKYVKEDKIYQFPRTRRWTVLNEHTLVLR